MSKVLYVANKGGRINGWGVNASTTHLVSGPKDGPVTGTTMHCAVPALANIGSGLRE